jgi:hypothetical protein
MTQERQAPLIDVWHMGTILAIVGIEASELVRPGISIKKQKQPKLPIIERAYGLARSGTCRDVNAIRRQLKSDGYGPQVRDFLCGRSLVADLKKLCQEHAKAEPL